MKTRRHQFRAHDDALAACEREPIHTPGAIQPFGSLLALEPGTRKVQYASEDLVTRFGGVEPLRALDGFELPFFGPGAVAKLGSVGQARQVGIPVDLGMVGLPTESGEIVRHATAHWNGRTVIVELIEPEGGAGPSHVGSGSAPPREPPYAVETELRRVLGDPWGDFSEFALRVVSRLRRLTGYERTMMYRFDDDGHGEVIAEDVAAQRERYLGLHYPATDIPAQARRLYLLNRVRQLGDVAGRSIPLASLGPSDPLDLSHAVLRDFSPVHREYLSNMGVRATLVASIVVGGRLWGLLVCHHDRSYWPPVSARLVVETLAEVVAGHVALREAYDHERIERRSLALRAHLAANLHSRDLSAELGTIGDELRALVDAEGLVVSIDGAVRTFGLTPPLDVVHRIVASLGDDASSSPSLITRSIGQALPELEGELGGFAGVMAVRGSWGYAAWLRKELVERVRWAGSTEKNLVEDDDGTIRLTPRKSFETWVAEVRGRARPFDQSALAVKEWFRGCMIERDLRSSPRNASSRRGPSRRERRSWPWPLPRDE